MQINGWTLRWHHVVFFAGLLTTIIGVAVSYGETKGGLKDMNRRVTKLECKQEQIWEMIRTQHVYDSLVAIARGDTMYFKAVNIVENGHDTIP